jgi:hypothetical protein
MAGRDEPSARFGPSSCRLAEAPMRTECRGAAPSGDRNEPVGSAPLAGRCAGRPAHQSCLGNEQHTGPLPADELGLHCISLAPARVRRRWLYTGAEMQHGVFETAALGQPRRPYPRNSYKAQVRGAHGPAVRAVAWHFVPRIGHFNT